MSLNSVVSVSVGLPVYNGENYLRAALESLLAQTFGDLEIIVSDNASTDGTADLVHEFRRSDRRIRYRRNERNLGANPNYNEAFSVARGEFFRWHAHDDVCEPRYLERCVAVLRTDPSVALVHSATRYIDRNGDPLVRTANGFVDPDGYVERLIVDEESTPLLAGSSASMRFDAVVNHLSVFFDVFGLGRTAQFRRTRLMRHFYGTDKVFLAEMALQGRLVRLDEELFLRRCHPAASTRSTGLRALASWSDASRHVNYYPAWIIAGYLDAIRTSDLTSSEKRRCRRALLKKLRSPYRLLLGR